MSEPFVGRAPLVPHQESGEHTRDGAAWLARPLPAVASPDPYLLAKVTVPPVRARIIPRSSLLSHLESHVPLTLLSAGAGYGKTTLLSAWARASRGHVAWLTLDSLENDPLRFWGYVLLALRRCVPPLEEGSVARFPSTDATALPHLLIALLNELAVGNEALTLILDDYHVIEEPAIHQSLGYFIEHAPACLRLILATRTDPELPLSRLRVRGQLVEIREAELLLSASEAADFLAQTMDLPLADTEVRALWQRTEGWITGLQLAALVLRSHPGPAALVHEFVGSHRLLVDYVQEEILEAVPLATTTFMLHTSVLTRMTAALCRAVTGEEAAASMLEALEQANLFVLPQDIERRWYRMHPLIREVLLSRMQRREPDLLPRLHQRAAHWYAQQNLLHEAIAHALDAGDGNLAADLITGLVVPQSWRNEYHTLRSFLSRLPQDVLRTRPDLSLLLVQALFLTAQVGSGSASRMEELLASAEQEYRRASQQAGVGSVLALRAILASFEGQFPAAFAAAHEALPLLPESDMQLRGQCLSAQALEALMAGSVELARARFQQALVCYDASGLLGGRQFVTAMLAEVRLVQGDRAGAAHGFRQVLGQANASPELARGQLTDERGNLRAHFERVAWYSLAALLYEENRLEEAQQALAFALAEGQFSWIHVLSPGLLLQVRMLCTHGKDEQAQALLDTLQARPQPPDVMREIQFCQAFLAFRRGRWVQVASWAAGLPTLGPPLSRAREVEEGLLLARLRIAQGEETAAQVLAPLLEEARAQGRGDAVLQLLVLLSLADRAGSNGTQAQQAALEAIALAHPQGAVRLFLEEGEAMEHVLRKLLPDLQDAAQAAYVRTLLHPSAKPQASHDGRTRTQAPAQAPTQTPQQTSPLTRQEHRVLQLLAQGASNQEIAHALVIELSTAKSHVSHLLGKLRATTRTQAIAYARELGLL